MRITAASGYEEPRDSLAQDWAGFMSTTLPEVAWVGIPNTGKSALQFVEAWGLEALILTGGDDIGETPRRDETERLLLDRFMQHGNPIFGVCRGMQLIHTEYGGSLSPCNPDDHVATRHSVRFVEELNESAPGVREATVNSFHTSSIGSEHMVDGLTPLAITGDGFVEAFRAASVPLIAVMWHPEREAIPSEPDRRLLRHLFGYPLHVPGADR